MRVKRQRLGGGKKVVVAAGLRFSSSVHKRVMPAMHVAESAVPEESGAPKGEHAFFLVAAFLRNMHT